MTDTDLIQKLEFEYHAIRAANADWDTTLPRFLEQRHVSRHEIWEHYPNEAEAEGWDTPDWL